MYCRKCGVKIEDDSAFCFKCGERVITLDAAAPSQLESVSAPAPDLTPMTEPVSTSEPKLTIKPEFVSTSEPEPMPAPIFESEPVTSMPQNTTAAPVSSIPVYKTEPVVVEEHAHCERTFSPVSDYINMDPSAAQARWSAPEIDMPMKWYKFLVYFALWAGAVTNFSEAVYGLFGIAKNDAEQYMYYFISGYEEYDRIAAIFLLGIIAFQIYTCIQLLGYRNKAPLFLIMMYAVLLVYNLITIIVVDLMMSVTIGYLTGNIIVVFLFYGLFGVLNAVYFYKRRHLFVY